MVRSRIVSTLLLIALYATVTGISQAATLVSSMQNVGAVMGDRGFYIVPVHDVGTMRIAGDSGQPQVFEIIRPRGEKITLGRLNTSCTCVQLESDKRTFERGERAFLTLRNVRATPPNGQMYAFYVQIASPIGTTLRYDTFVQSDRFSPHPRVQTVENRRAYRRF